MSHIQRRREGSRQLAIFLRSSLVAAAIAVAASCTAPANSPSAAPATPQPISTADENAEDNGTYLRRIDPLGGQWRVQRVGTDDFTVHKAWIDFSAGGFLNHSAGCGGGYPAFYQLSGARLTITRLETIRIGKCAAAGPPARAAAAASERRLASFLIRQRRGSSLTRRRRSSLVAMARVHRSSDRSNPILTSRAAGSSKASQVARSLPSEGLRP
ncbi:hypothetical protein [Sphingomonas turrisvirgatae]|uniref:DUF306 domain-containing protein n=1 Tax=Sphingomonas turrisvirgatae TaxID=1888892 RepID=A0A1E3LV60_9SPHN|nr:hypothetical protein [Sphingomonas turrisvirgatae]ODP37045.1 hypothetical protein BFL28_18980 [Sphingomonas turrisvirgatae]